MENLSTNKINETFAKTKSILFENQIIRLTPEEVTTFDDSGILSRPWKPGLFAARYETIYLKDKQCNTIHEKNWTYKDKYTSKKQNWTAGIYTSNIKFPELCVACMKPAEQYEVVELCDSKNVSIGKATIPVTTQKEAERISYAFLWDRYWIPVPFCKEHNLESKAIHITKGGDEFTFGFINKQYGESFSEINNLKGFWRTKSNLFLYRFLFPFLLIMSGLGIFTGILLLVRGFKGQLGKAVATSTDIPVGFILAFVFTTITVILVIKIIKFETLRTIRIKTKVIE